MNAPIKIEKTHNADCPAMLANAERWRAQCIDNFANLEVVIEDLLRDLKSHSKHGAKVRTGQLVGSAFAHLRELTSEKGLFVQKGAGVAATIRLLARCMEWRAHLTHGVMKVWRGGNGQWLMTFDHREPGKDDGPIRCFAIPWSDALSLKKELADQVEALRQNARSLSNSIRKA